MKEKKYLVRGVWKEERVEELVNAYSVSQAKMKAGFKLGIGGMELGKFIRSNSIQVKVK